MAVENTLQQRGDRFVKAEPLGDDVYSYWQEAKPNYGMITRTADRRYKSIGDSGWAGICEWSRLHHRYRWW